MMAVLCSSLSFCRKAPGCLQRSLLCGWLFFFQALNVVVAVPLGSAPQLLFLICCSLSRQTLHILLKAGRTTCSVFSLTLSPVSSFQSNPAATALAQACNSLPLQVSSHPTPTSSWFLPPGLASPSLFPRSRLF